MSINDKAVFVLGAGFTKAFLPGAPLMIDDYESDYLSRKFEGCQAAQHLLEIERHRNQGRQINVERLMTRLHGGMPYDADAVRDELRFLLAELTRCFIRRIESAKAHEMFGDELAAFARYCVEKRITCVSFNYDDVLDEMLWRAARAVRRPMPDLYWHPDGGYGFYCRPSLSTVRDYPPGWMDRTSMLLLKLHGSMNWRALRGALAPYRVDEILHEENWLDDPEVNRFREGASSEILAHLEPEPFIVPPVLMKSILTEQPVLRLVWSLAHRELSQATRVVFLGYSLPRTDIAAGVLFSEALQHGPVIEVINYAENDQVRADLIAGYRAVFPQLEDQNVDFRGALRWARELVR